MGPPSVGPDFAPAAAASSPLGASKIAEPTDTAEPARRMTVAATAPAATTAPATIRAAPTRAATG